MWIVKHLIADWLTVVASMIVLNDRLHKEVT